MLISLTQLGHSHLLSIVHYENLQQRARFLKSSVVYGWLQRPGVLSDDSKDFPQAVSERHSNGSAK